MATQVDMGRQKMPLSILKNRQTDKVMLHYIPICIEWKRSFRISPFFLLLFVAFNLSVSFFLFPSSLSPSHAARSKREENVASKFMQNANLLSASIPSISILAHIARLLLLLLLPLL